jgi:hypothetical protein
MGKHSFLGPTDPQLILTTPLGVRFAPAQAILAQFDRAVEDCADPKKLAAWLPILGQYGPDLLIQCEELSAMAKNMVQKWLESYMFKGEADGSAKADRISTWLATHSNFRSHAKHIERAEAEANELRVEYLENDQTAQDLFLSIFHATTHTFSSTTAVKIIENQLGKAFIKQQAVTQVTMPVPGQAALPGPVQP